MFVYFSFNMKNCTHLDARNPLLRWTVGAARAYALAAVNPY